MEVLTVNNPIIKALPIIEFKEYETLKQQAQYIARRLEDIEVNEENIKENKKLIAKVNKSIKELNDRRIYIKKEILKPYEDFNDKIKDIESIVKNADSIVRKQIKEIEEKEREEKENELLTIWNKRVSQYDWAKNIDFYLWLEPRHLNKTQKIEKSEDEIIKFLEKVEKDLETLSEMEHREDLIVEYKSTLDMATAINNIKDKYKKIEEEKRIIKEIKEETEKKYYFVIDDKDYNFTKLLLETNKIKFEIKEI